MHRERVATPTRTARRIDFLPWLLIALGAALRLFRIDWGLPDLYEEATPLVQAWEIWNWGPTGSVDLNPHFFNYPSLTLYVHFLITGVLFLMMKACGAVSSGLEYSVRYLSDPTPIIVAARCVTVAFGAATLGLIWRIGSAAAGKAAAVLATLLLALNPLHFARSQMIEVDVPLTFFVCATLWFALRITREPRRHLYLLAGACAGLATSTKYTGALVNLSLLAGHLLACEACGSVDERGNTHPAGGRYNPSWRNLLLAAVAACVAFLVTSPFVLIDFHAFWRTMTLESQHMELGHFGRADASTLALYGRSLVEQVMGLPLLILATIGLVYFCAIRRARWALVLVSFMVPYFVTVVGWSMHADRYM